MPLRVPEYYYAKPRYENTGLPEDQANKQAGAGNWSLTPNSTFEAGVVFTSLAGTGALNYKVSSRFVPGYKGIWKYVIGYGIGLAVARWADKASVGRYLHEDKVLKQYMDLHPERFPVYVPKTMKETFGPWYPIRNGPAESMKEQEAIFRVKDTDHYVPDADENKA